MGILTRVKTPPIVRKGRTTVVRFTNFRLFDFRFVRVRVLPRVVAPAVHIERVSSGSVLIS